MYATLDDFVTFVRAEEATQVTTWESDEPFINRELAELHLNLSTAKINGALANRYTIPITPSPPQLKYICLRIAHWSAEQLGEVRQSVQIHYEEAIKDLDKLAKGTDALISADGKVILPISDQTTGDKVFTFVGQRSTNNTYVPAFGTLQGQRQYIPAYVSTPAAVVRTDTTFTGVTQGLYQQDAVWVGEDGKKYVVTIASTDTGSYFKLTEVLD